MSNNLYAPPLANLDEQVRSEADDRFYVVSTRKMLILTFATLGLYTLYWNFKNWSLYRQASGDSVWPVPRALFAVFFTHSLFRNIANHDTTGERRGWDSDSYATTLVLVMVIGYVLSWTSQGSFLFDALAMLTLIPCAMLLKQAQIEINARCGDPAGSSNEDLTAANIVWCVIGGLFWLMALAGLFIGKES